MLALYGIMVHKRWLTLFGLLVALLCKEDMGLVVFGVGVYLLVAERDWGWGIGFALLGVVWSLLVSFWVIALFRPDLAEYPQLFYYDYLGSSYQEIVQTLMTDPLILFRTLFSIERLQALGRILLPLGVVLPLLSPTWLIIAAPSAALLLFSGDMEMAQLEKWYSAPLLPVLFAAVVALLARLPAQPARWVAAWLLASAVVGFLLFSPLPPGGNSDPSLYEVTAHDRVVAQMMDQISAEASVATQPHYVPHLAHRDEVYHFPWVRSGLETVDAILLDPQTDPYPLTQDELLAEINQYLANPAVTILASADGAYLFAQNQPPANSWPVDATFEDGMHLSMIEIAVEDETGFFQPVTTPPIVVAPGRQLRVSLYWQAKASDIPNDRNANVRISDPASNLYGQHDGPPASGLYPTSSWQAGQALRDIHTFSVQPAPESAELQLELVIYDWQTQEIVVLEDSRTSLPLSAVEIRSLSR